MDNTKIAIEAHKSLGKALYDAERGLRAITTAMWDSRGEYSNETFLALDVAQRIHELRVDFEDLAITEHSLAEDTQVYFGNDPDDIATID